MQYRIFLFFCIAEAIFFLFLIFSRILHIAIKKSKITNYGSCILSFLMEIILIAYCLSGVNPLLSLQCITCTIAVDIAWLICTISFFVDSMIFKIDNFPSYLLHNLIYIVTMWSSPISSNINLQDAFYVVNITVCLIFSMIVLFYFNSSKVRQIK